MRLGVVLIGYSRFDWIEKNIHIISQLSLPYIVCIDGSSSDRINELQEQFVNSRVNDKDCIFRADINKGVRYFIPESISLALRSFECVLVLEDDVEISEDSINFVLDNISWLDKGLISLFQPNDYMNSFVNEYGGIWGWAVSAKIWDQFSLGTTPSISFRCIITNHGLLKALFFYPLIELSRIGASKSWAYEFLSFRWQKGINSLQPSLSLARNHGLGDINAENTKRGHVFANTKIKSFRKTNILFGKKQSLMSLTGFSLTGLLLRIINAWMRLIYAKLS